MKQLCDTLFMVRPANFEYNTETANSNVFQSNIYTHQDSIMNRVLDEFDNAVKTLRQHNLNIIVFEDTNQPIKPDAIFPNNWGSYHEDGTVILYPMAAINRRAERRKDIINSLANNFCIKRVIDISSHEKDGIFLESTGSIIFNHIDKKAYACFSERTNKSLLIKVCDQLGYKPILFNALDENNTPIYHSNVMMCITDKLVIICLDSIKNSVERNNIICSFNESKHHIINISLEQIKTFAGNMLGVKNTIGESLLLMSKSAYRSLTKQQINEIELYTKILNIDVSTIENIGGGSIRCMLAEIFLPRKNK